MLIFYNYSFDYPQKNWIRLGITRRNAGRCVINLTATFFAKKMVGWRGKSIRFKNMNLKIR